MFLERIDTQNNRTKVLLFFYMSKYFDKKVPKNMFFNILCLFFDYSDSKMSLMQILCHFVSQKEDGKVFDNCELRILNYEL